VTHRPSYREYGRWCLEIGIIVLFYYGAARLGLFMAFTNKNVSSIWPPSGLALAMLLTLGPRVWPAITLGAFLANYTTGLSIPTAFAIGTGNTLEAVIGAYLLRRVGFQYRQGRLRDILGLILLGGMVSPTVAATIGVASLRVGGYIGRSAWPSAWWTWWLGDGMGILVVTPVLLAWVTPIASLRSWTTSVKPWRVLEAGVLLMSLVGVTHIIFDSGQEYPYAVFPFLIWATMRFGQRGATSAVLVVSGLAVWGTLQGVGPFVKGTVEQSLEYLQTFMGVVSITTLVMAAAMAEREQLVLELQRNQYDIEALNERLRRALAETHHRVKNNLQVICAMIELQETQGKELVATSELQRLAQHVRSLAVIHELLTHEAKTSADADHIHIREAMEQLMPLLQSVVGDRNLHFAVDDARIPIRQGTALAVLVNELVSNALKHGAGDIDLSLAVLEQTARLVVCDRGPGVPPEFDPWKNASTGMELIYSLSTWDLGGQVSFENRPEGGARVLVTFPIVRKRDENEVTPLAAS
jgi:integral membrane sensor domain MASE1